MKKLFLSTMLVLASMTLFAQKAVVVVDYFTSPSCNETAITALRSQVIADINAMNRVTLIDVQTESSLALEADRRSSELALEDQTARLGAMKTLGADYIITGVVTKMSADYEKPSEGSPYYNGNIMYSLKIVKVEDGSIMGTENFTYAGLTGNTGSTSEEAIVSTLKKVKQSMDNFVNEYFKLKGTIVEMGEAKGGKAKNCYVSLGSDHGMAKGQKLDVFEVKTIAGREAQTHIGVLTVDEVVAQDLSHCNISSGAKEILAATQRGSELRVETKKDNAFVGGLKSFVAM
ncbi:MAG: penicillin-binding protein activator LpoB [Bacteroidales bacterium]|nr:penicillin-binding protein activator LpoB [Bacteroidales bacterium]